MRFYTKLIAYIIITQLATVTVIFLFSKHSKNPQIAYLAKHIPMGTAFLAVIGIFVTMIIFRNQYDKTVMEMTLDVTTDNLTHIHELFVTYYKDCPKFIESMMFDFEKSKQTNTVSKTNENKVIKRMIAIRIIQCVENYFVTASLTSTSDSEVMCTFLSYFNSLELQHEEFPMVKYNISKQTRMYIEKLFDINNKNKFKSSDEVIKYCDNFILSGQLDFYLNYIDPTNVTQR